MNKEENKINVGNSTNKDKKAIKVLNINYNKGSGNEKDFKIYCKSCGYEIPKKGTHKNYIKRKTCGDYECQKKYQSYLRRKNESRRKNEKKMVT